MNDIGKIPPQAIDLEEAVLGAFMLEPSSLYMAEELQPDAFYKDANRLIFGAIRRLVKRSDPVDILTVTNELRTIGELEAVGGAFAVTSLTNRVASAANVEYHIRIIIQKYIQRELIRFSSELIDKCYNDIDDVFDLVERAQNKLIQVTNQSADNLRHIQDCIKDVLDIIDHNFKNDNQITGIPTGFVEIDRFTNGLQKSDLIIMAGETSQGKTSAALNVAGNAATIFKKSIGIWSYEMSNAQITARLMAQSSGISSKVLLMKKIEAAQFEILNTKIKQLIESNIYIDDVTDSSIDYLERQIRAAVVRKGIELVIVDYLQLIKNNMRGTKAQQVGDIANRLKVLAKTLQIPIILISQLARSENHTPTLGRLKESGDIENAADIVWLLWRPDFFGINDIEHNNERVSSRGISQHIFAKGRNIGVANFLLSYNPSLTLFEDPVVERVEVPF